MPQPIVIRLIGLQKLLQEALILLGGLTGELEVFQRVSRKIFGHGVGNLVFETQELEDENTGEKTK